MKVILFNGSRNEKGYTYTALRLVADELNAMVSEAVEAGKRAGVAQPESEKKLWTNFIR